MSVLFASFLAQKKRSKKSLIKTDVKFLFQDSQLTLIDSCLKKFYPKIKIVFFAETAKLGGEKSSLRFVRNINLQNPLSKDLAHQYLT